MRDRTLAALIGLSLFTATGSAHAHDPFAELDAATAALEQSEPSSSHPDASHSSAPASSPAPVISTPNEEKSRIGQLFEHWKSAQLTLFSRYRQQAADYYDRYRNQLFALWGEAVLDSADQVVSYSQDHQSRAVINYEKQQIQISLLHHQDHAVNAQDAFQALQTLQATEAQQSQGLPTPLMRFMAKQQATTLQQHLQAAPVSKHPARLDQQDYQQAKAVIHAQAERQQQELAKTQDMLTANETTQGNLQVLKQLLQYGAHYFNDEQEQIESEKNARLQQLEKATKNSQSQAKTDHTITTFTLPLPQEKSHEMAAPYLPSVLIESKRWTLSPSLVLAVIHTESHFNPKAKSHIPAFGLMQIVPTSAGVDINRFLHNKDEPMSPALLLQPNPNIEAGSAYLHLLNQRHFPDINDPLSRQYCVIAAYNTGSGNVARAFNQGKRLPLRQAITRINRMTPEQVYQTLLSALPYEETRHYLQKVNQRLTTYQQYDKVEI